ncbi:MAG TPA: ABC transporter ATP-binding protein [Polyangiaceae bacterium]|nr:ABC transporter ATP-binding protein [Polyangiaceae bacterium]
MSERVLDVQKVSKDYGEHVVTHALRDVSVALEAGEFAALIGPSGSGKSTLLNLIGLLDRPTSGRVVLAGCDTSGLDERALTTLRGKTLGFIFQAHMLLPAFTALENVMMPAWAHQGVPDAGVRARAAAMLDDVGLEALKHRRVTDLSGGQQQRVAIARALAHRPALVLADEPTGNLDTQTSDGVFELLRRLNRELGTSFLIVTHDPRIAGRCDRVIDLVDGRVRSDQRRDAAPESPPP